MDARRVGTHKVQDAVWKYQFGLMNPLENDGGGKPHSGSASVMKSGLCSLSVRAQFRLNVVDRGQSASDHV